MATNALKVNLLDDLQVEVAQDDLSNEVIHLTPYLVLACGLLYMVSSDGELCSSESSFIQSVLGGDEEVLRYGVHYVQSVPFDRFLIDAPEALSSKDKWCILTNVADALLSDGKADPNELAQFKRLKQAFGIEDHKFETFFKVLALKNNKSILGRYGGTRSQRQPMTPHLAFACALLYMLSSDGSIGAQETGQLEVALGEFDGLLKAALTYARSVKIKNFLDEASIVLNSEQKLFILLNVCDAMLVDGAVAGIEDSLFVSILNSFQFNETTFSNFYEVIETKSIKPFNTDGFKNLLKHNRLSSSDASAGEKFDNVIAGQTLLQTDAQSRDASQIGAPIASRAELETSQFITRQMVENTQKINGKFNDHANIAKVESNATEGLNYQQIDTESGSKNRQKVKSQARSQNKQLIDTVFRAQNIQAMVGDIHLKLDHFERSNFRFLALGRRQKFTDEFVPVSNNGDAYNKPHLANQTLAQNVLFNVPQSVLTREFLTSSLLALGEFRVLCKQIAVALTLIVFSSPIYTQSANHRAAAGVLVKSQLTSEILQAPDSLDK